MVGKNVRFRQDGGGQLRVEIATEPGRAALAGLGPDGRAPRPVVPGQREPGIDLGVVGLAAGHDGGRGDSARPGIEAVADPQPEDGRQSRRRGMVPPVQQQDGREGAEAD